MPRSHGLCGNRLEVVASLSPLAGTDNCNVGLDCAVNHSMVHAKTYPIGILGLPNVRKKVVVPSPGAHVPRAMSRIAVTVVPWSFDSIRRVPSSGKLHLGQSELRPLCSSS